MANPRISVIIPVFNQAKYLADAIESVLVQTYPAHEIVVVDDGSTDNAYAVTQPFASQIRYVRQENQGLASARNMGIRQTRGEYVALLDCDDQWLPQFLESIAFLIMKHPNGSVYHCSARCMDAEGNDLPQLAGAHGGASLSIYQTLLRANYLIPSTIVVRRSTLDDVGLFDQATREIHGCEDWDLWLRIARQFSFVSSPACLVRYRLHGRSLSADVVGMQQAARAVIEKHFGPEEGEPETWSPEKRRAYGGVHWYAALTTLQRKEDWPNCSLHFGRALTIDPTLADDPNLFYELALGAQPLGYRGSGSGLDLKGNAAHLDRMLMDLFNPGLASEVDSSRTRVYGMAYHGLGQVAYNTGQLSLARQFLLKAWGFEYGLILQPQFTSTLVKAFLGRILVARLKRLGNKGTQSPENPGGARNPRVVV